VQKTTAKRTPAKHGAWQASLKQLKIEQSDIHLVTRVAPQNGGKPGAATGNIDLLLENIALMTKLPSTPRR
jgi:hypothetical protein